MVCCFPNSFKLLKNLLSDKIFCVHKSTMDDDSDDNMIDCEGIGDPVYVDKDLSKFYTAFKTDWLYVSIGDCVRINMANNGTAFGQVLAIYENIEEEMFIEIRWFVGHDEIKHCKNLKSFSIQPNELFESDDLSDISAGAVAEIISLKDSIQDASISMSSYFICRLYMMNSASGSLTQSNLATLFQRGISKSAYRKAYASYLESYVYNHQSDEYSLAIQRLHISVIPDNLPCREQQREMIMQFIKEGIVEHGSKKPLYVCGTPGTGKTATVIAVITALQKQAETGIIPSFHFVEINCLRLKNPTDAYTQLWRGISGDHESSVKALKQLKAHFNDESRNDYIVHRPKKGGETSIEDDVIDKNKVVVCLLDELDYLITRDFEVMYNFFNWPRIEGATIVIVGIANTMDLPEKLQSKIESRSGLSVNRLTFKPYKFNEVQQILQHRLSELKLDTFDKASIEFMARKAETVGGDLRAALKICQRTIELFRDQVNEDQAAQRASKMQRVSQETSEQGSSVALSQSVVNKPRSNFDKIKEMVLKAVESYKQNPFIAVVSRSTQLEKVILIILVRSRRHDDNENPDAVDSEKGLTVYEVTERVQELVGTIINEQKLTTPVVVAPSGGPSVFVDLIPDHPAVAEPNKDSVHRIYLLEPSERVVKDALIRLCRLGLIQVTHNRLLDEANAVYTLHKSFMHSNLTAALKEDPLHKYCK